jgi:hypothetical protein
MRNPNRIKPIISKLEELWLKSPDLRFGQLVYILASKLEVGDIFFPEDDKWLEAIEEAIEERE